MKGKEIDIDDFVEEELVALNHRIVERLKYLESYHTHQEMMKFSPGSKVSFHPSGREPLIGTLVKFNKKTVTVMTESGQKWNVSPHLLSLIKDVSKIEGSVHSSTIIELPRKN